MPEEAAIAADPQPNPAAPHPVAENTPATPEPVTPAAESDPSDPYSLLEQAMNAQLDPDDAAKPEAQPENEPNAAPEAQIPPEFENAFGISDYVQSPEHLEQAIRAADEVWRVAAGEVPAYTLLEGMRTANPEGFEKVVGGLIPYLEQITGRKFGEPGTAPDPRDERLSAIEQQIQQQEEARRQEVFQHQVNTAHDAALNFVTEKLKGTFAEGNEAFVLRQCADVAGIPEQQMMQMVLSGNMSGLEKALRTVQKAETERLKAYNANLVKSYRALKNGVPGVKGVSAKAAPDDTAYLPGETVVEHATRLFNAGR